ncbi:MAG: hypothetical protein RIM84_09085 [Alphaproteobacteria bacterium]
MSTDRLGGPRSGGARLDLPLGSFLWLWLPLGWLVFHFGWRIADEASYRRIWDSEQGPEENATNLLLLVAVAAGIATLRHWRRLGSPLAITWVAAMTVGCFYFAGEEISWGQHWFGWGTPEGIAQLNDQGETNLHNMSSWLDQKPRLALELWTLFGGVLATLGLAARLRLTGGFWTWVWPPRLVLPSALLALAVGWLERIKGLAGWTDQWPIDVRLSETQEWYFALFLMLSLLSIWQRAKQMQTPAAPRQNN